MEKRHEQVLPSGQPKPHWRRPDVLGAGRWALGGGYTTNLDKAELFTLEQAKGKRDTDIPWPKAYIEERAHLGVDR